MNTTALTPFGNGLEKRYLLQTWGCQMNDEDSEQIALYLEEMGYRPAASESEADLVMLNTCAVRQKPEEKVYSRLGELRMLKQERPGMLIGVCGCMAQVESVEIKKRAPYVDLVIGTGNLGALPGLVRAAEARLSLRNGNDRTVYSLDLPERKGAVVTDVPLRNLARKPKLKAHVPIMYGCDKFCTFCIVPYTRGRERSRPTQEIVREVEMLARSGTKEITLLGQTVNSYGKNLAEGRVAFAELLRQLHEIPGLKRIRYTSPYPRDFSDDLIQAIAELPKVCKHVHLPLQVADNALLKEMKRGYTLEQYDEIVHKLREQASGIAITTDLMLGYPGETDEQFWNTMRYVEQTRFDSAFMFAYSPRPGTKAAALSNQIPHEVKIDRLTRLIELQNAITLAKNQAMIGSEVEVLVEGPSTKDPARLMGYSDTLKTVLIPTGSEDPTTHRRWIGKVVRVSIREAALTGFTGTIVD